MIELDSGIVRSELAYYAVTYACDSCEKDTGFARIISVKPPVPLFPGGKRKGKWD